MGVYDDDYLFIDGANELSPIVWRQIFNSFIDGVQVEDFYKGEAYWLCWTRIKLVGNKEKDGKESRELYQDTNL